MSIEFEAHAEAEKRWPISQGPIDDYRMGRHHGFIRGYVAGATRPVTDAEVRAVAPFVYELLRTDQPVTQRDVDSAVRAALEAARALADKETP